MLQLLVAFSIVGQGPPPLPQITRLPHDGYRVTVAFSPDGKTLVTGGQDNHLRFWDVATAKQRFAVKHIRRGQAYLDWPFFQTVA